MIKMVKMYCMPLWRKQILFSQLRVNQGREGNAVDFSKWILWGVSHVDAGVSGTQKGPLGNCSLHFYIQEFQATVQKRWNFWRKWRDLCDSKQYQITENVFALDFFLIFLWKFLFLLSFCLTFTYTNSWLFCILSIQMT